MLSPPSQRNDRQRASVRSSAFGERRLLRGRFAAFFWVACLVALGGCYTERGSGEVTVVSHDLTGFNGVRLVGAGELSVASGAFAVSVSAEDNVMPSVVVEMDGDTLVLRRESGWGEGVRPSFPIEFMVTLPALKAVRVSGSGNAAVQDVPAEDGLMLTVYGSGTIRVAAAQAPTVVANVQGSGGISLDELTASRFVSRIDGSGRVTATGAAGDVTVNIGGSGLHRSTGLRAAAAEVEIAGSGQALLWAERRLDVQINGDGSVTYRGDPAVNAVGGGSDRVRRQGG